MAEKKKPTKTFRYKAADEYSFATLREHVYDLDAVVTIRPETRTIIVEAPEDSKVIPFIGETIAKARLSLAVEDMAQVSYLTATAVADDADADRERLRSTLRNVIRESVVESYDHRQEADGYRKTIGMLTDRNNRIEAELIERNGLIEKQGRGLDRVHHQIRAIALLLDGMLPESIAKSQTNQTNQTA